MASGVRALRMLSGEDVFGKVDDVAVFDTGNWKGVEITNLENAAVLQVRMDEKTKQPMVGFSPYSPFGEIKDVKIATDKIVMSYKPKRDIENAYNQTLGSGIIKPTGPLPNLKS
jgi:hypothetical protein|tara:strand:- start:3045 stop:3386 length:342 start_codon:yes stop_codon:yes gene_type:complete